MTTEYDKIITGIEYTFSGDTERNTTMLQIKQISKQYKTASLTQQALNKVSLNLRDNEFVAILGPSGSGKTTLLNIIGGLDRYDSGDLIINSISTKNYKDRDWDSYRNHTLGFVFQSYNLIPHQSILANVELALTISGVSKKQRRQRAKEALEKVGLAEHIRKRPNQLSGGQMQRVAIARALVNDPDILLADEPTGALDSTTSVQVMELLKEVAQDRLVVMVTHNPELAEEYATRIVRLKDGVITSDTDPFVPEENSEPPVHKNLGKSSMSFLTAFSLSANNLMTKKGRTILTAFAGSIGIIGISLILALSTGFQNYIDKIQEDTLTSYPLTITSETGDATSMLLAMVQEDDKDEEGVVYEQQVVSSMFSSIGTNDLKSLKSHLEEHQDVVDEYVSILEYSYSVSPQIFTKFEDQVIQVNPSTLMSSISGADGSMMTTMSSMSSMGSSSVFNEMLDDMETLKSQYDVLAGRWPEKYNEMILVLSDPSSISDMMVYSLGLRDADELKDMITKLMAKEQVESTNDPMQFTYEQLMNLEYKLVDATDTYQYNEKYDIYESMTADQQFMKKVYDEAETLKIVGIVYPSEDSTSSSLTPGIGYLHELTKIVISRAEESEIVQKQMANREVDVFSGKRFDDDSSESGLDFQDLISIDTKMLESAFGTNISEDQIMKMTQDYMTEIGEAITADTSEAEIALNTVMKTLMSDFLSSLIDQKGTEDSGILPDADAAVEMVNQMLAYLQNNYPQIQINQEVIDSLLEALKNQETSSTKSLVVKKSESASLVSEYMKTEAVQKTIQELSIEYLLPVEAFTMIYEGFINGFFEMMFGLDSSGSQDPELTLTSSMADPLTSLYTGILELSGGTQKVAITIVESQMQMTIMSKVGELMGKLMESMANAFQVDPNKIAGAFQFDLSEEELMRLMQTLSASGVEKNADTNLMNLGYQDLEKPTSISFYFVDFDSKELFMDFLNAYNDEMELVDENKVIKYTDLTGLLMSSVKTIVDSVSYVLIAFVSISLVVSSIMIGIITYISVLERTKEIGVLRAIGASKRNISSIFNAETFIIGLFAGLLGIGVTLALITPINAVIHNVSGNMSINAVLPLDASIILVILSVVLTLIGGLIPSSQAAKKDPVTALRTE